MSINMRGLEYLLVVGLLGATTGGFNCNEQGEICGESVDSMNTQEDMVFFDDFESYQTGTYPSTTWTRMYTGISAEISSEKYYSPTKSFRLSAHPSWARSDYIQIGYMDRFCYEAKVYVDEKAAAVGFSLSRGGFNPTYNMIRFQHDGNIYFKGKEKHLIQSFSYKEWYTVRVYIDYVDLEADVYIDDRKKGENLEIYSYSFHDDRWGDVTLNEFTVHIPNFDSGTGAAYFDDIMITEGSSTVKNSDFSLFFYVFLVLAATILVGVIISKKRKKGNPIYDDNTKAYDDGTRLY